METDALQHAAQARAAFELAAASMGSLSRQASTVSSSSSVTSPLINTRSVARQRWIMLKICFTIDLIVYPRSRSSSRPPAQPRLSGSEFWSRLRSPSLARRPRRPDQENSGDRGGGGGWPRSKSSSRALASSASAPSLAVASRRFGAEVNRGEDKLVRIRCVRLKEDRSQEEIDIELPEAVFHNLEDSSPHKSVANRRSTKLLSYFGKGLNK